MYKGIGNVLGRDNPAGNGCGQTMKLTLCNDLLCLYVGTSFTRSAPSCKAILDYYPNSQDGEYYIDGARLDDGEKSYCAMSDGGWTYAGASSWFRVSFTGGSVKFQAPTLPEGSKGSRFHFVLYGGNGGDAWKSEPTPARGGYGGSCEGTYLFDSGELFYFYVGGQGGEGYVHIFFLFKGRRVGVGGSQCAQCYY